MDEHPAQEYLKIIKPQAEDFARRFACMEPVVYKQPIPIADLFKDDFIHPDDVASIYCRYGIEEIDFTDTRQAYQKIIHWIETGSYDSSDAQKLMLNLRETNDALLGAYTDFMLEYFGKENPFEQTFEDEHPAFEIPLEITATDTAYSLLFLIENWQRREDNNYLEQLRLTIRSMTQSIYQKQRAAASRPPPLKLV